MINKWKQYSGTQEDLPAAHRKGFNSWYSDHWGKVIGAKKATEEIKALEYSQYLTDGGAGQVANAITLMNSRNAKVTAEDPETHYDLQVYPCLLPDLTRVTQEGLSEVSFSSSDVDGRHQIEKWKARGKARLFGFIRVGGGGSGKKESRWERSLAFTVSFQNLRAVSIQRNWLDGTVLNLFHDAKYFQEPREDKPYIVTPEQLWARDGLWPFTPSRLIVGYKPSIVVKFDDASWSEAKTSFGGGASVSLGPFKIGGSGGKSSYERKWSDRDRTLTITSDSRDIYVVGVVSQDNSRYLNEGP